MVRSIKIYNLFTLGLTFLMVLLGEVNPINAQDQQALIDFYNATDGPNWTNNTNWNTDAPISDWYGVTANFAGVVKLELSNNNLKGNIPNSISQLLNIEELKLNGNQLTGTIPFSLYDLINLRRLELSDNQLTGPIYKDLVNGLSNSIFLSLDDNRFIFSDLDPEFLTYANKLGTNFQYIPQAKVDLTETKSATVGTSITLVSNALTSINNSYIWYKDGIAITGPTDKVLTISNVKDTDAGVYTFKAVNSTIINLELERNPITVIVESNNDCVSAEERQALIDFYIATAGDNWTNTLASNKPWLINDPGSSVCDWYGVSVTNGKITKLDLPNNNLTGEIHPSINRLSGLKFLTLHTNQLSGRMPKELGELIALRRLWLNNNRLLGSIPPEISQLINLQDLNLSQNQLGGNIPAELGQLSNLKKLFLSDNQFTGNIPAEFGQLTNLITLNLHQNQLSGNIPVALGQLTKLITLNVYRNQLSGNIPVEIGQLTNLAILNLFKNQLSGSIPVEIGQLINLRDLNLGSNQLSGNIPASIGNLNKLTSLKLNGNQLLGTIPDTIQQLTLLQHLFLDNNSLRGKIPDISGFANLNALRIEKNEFVFSDFESEFSIYKTKMENNFKYRPQAKVDQTETQSLVQGQSITFTSNVLTSPNNNYQWYKDGRAVTGATNKELVITNASDIDEGVYTFKAINSVVTDLELERNPITLSLVQNTDCVSVEERQALIDFYNATDGDNWTNTLVGNKPWLINDPSSKVCDWYGVTVFGSKVTKLELQNNDLTGEIPNSIDKLADLQTLWLHINQLSGNIPPEVWQLTKLEQLQLNNNQFTGSIPITINQLTKLKVLYLSNNKLIGNIIPELSKLSNLLDLRLSGNQLSGIIPPELSLLTNLQVLILSNNQITGSIPSELSQLTKLIELNFSNNQLSGSIPSELESLTKLNFLFLNGNQLSGIVPITFSQFSNLQQLYLYDNQLSGKISDFSGISSLVRFFFENNNFVFSDFETEFSSYQTKLGNQFRYAPQAKVDQTATQSVAPGGSITLTSNVLTSPNNSYQWYKNNRVITGATNKNLVISNASDTDAGVYFFRATNSVVTNLRLERYPITLSVVQSTDCVSATERQALIDLYNATGGDNWANTLAGNKPWLVNDPNSSVCDWFGVNVVNGMVTELKLDDNNLEGNLSSSIGQLSNLQSIRLRENRLEGNIPLEIGLLSNLIELNLYENNLIGNIPPEIGQLTNLQKLILNTNQLTGSIPSELGQLENLEHLFLSTNQLEHSIPSQLGFLTKLKTLYLDANQLTGSIPSEFGQLASLQVLGLANNQLTGSIPSEFGQLTNLQRLNITTNMLSGNIPPSFRQLSNLRQLHLSNNQLKGKVPNLSELSFFLLLWIDNNNFIFSDFESEFNAYQTKIGANFRYAPQAKVDQLETQSVAAGGSITLTGNVLISPNNRYQWYKDGIAITGAIEKELVITNASDTDAGVYTFKTTNSIITNLELERNPITLTIGTGSTCTVSAEERQALIDFYIATNGDDWTNTKNGDKPWLINDPNSKVCDWYGITVVNNRVAELDLQLNNLTGDFPVSIIDLLSLESVKLSLNNITGEIPGEIRKLTSLQQLGLSNNQLTGSIPTEWTGLAFLKSLHLHHNNLTGTIPKGLGILSDLKALYLNNNNLTGSIPETLGELSSLNSLNLSYNNLEGEVPIALNQLVSLNILYLNNNELSGKIPDFTGSQFSLTPIFYIHSNNFIFSNFETEFNAYQAKMGANFKYTPQAKVDLTVTQSVAPGGSIALTSNVLTSPNNSYQWYKDGIAISGATEKELLITNASDTDAGIYIFKATNSVVTNLELERNPITLTIGDNNTCVVSAAERQALIDLYNATDGDNWTNTLAGNRPWLINDPNSKVCDWYGVTVTNGINELQLSVNGLNGEIPSSIGQLINLSNLYLQSNGLTGEIPIELGQLTGLQRIYLFENKLTGEIPMELGDLTKLRVLYLSVNELSGSIPLELKKLKKLVTLVLNHNQLSGSIPSEFNELSNLSNFRANNNKFNGKIPNLTLLFNISTSTFHIENNKFIFSDFETEFSAYQTKMGSDFKYIPQAKVDQVTTQSVALGNSITLTSNVLTSPNNTYQWYKDGIAITGAIEKELVITNASDTDAGVYTFKATNSIVTNLELERNPITLVIGDPGGTDCTNLLDAFAVDTSFESAVSVVINGRNETLGATGWDIGEGTPDTFLPPFTTEPSGDPFISYTFNSAPNGGICAGALRRGNNTESFSKELSGLIPGTTYVVEFYQANATRLLIPELLEEAYGYWEVRLGSEPQYTTPMQPNSLIPAWQRARLEFTATTAIQRIEFLAASSAVDPTNSYPVYVLIDGIRFYKKPQATDIACSDIEIQSFCNLIFEEPTIGDLISPLTGATSWYKEQVGGVSYKSDALLSDLGTTIFWADNDSGASRMPIEVIFDLGAPDGDGYQSFDIYDTPTISDLIVSGENISWYATPAGTTALLPSTPLVHENTYYAAKGTNSCRLAVKVVIQVPEPIGSGLQTFCSTTNPTIADLIIQPTKPEYQIRWYSSETGTQIYLNESSLVDGQTYYAVQTNGILETAERFPVKVIIVNTDSTPRIYDRDIAVPLQSTVGTLTTFFRLDATMVWYNLPTGGRPYDPTDVLFDGKTYYARIGNEPCDASEILAVTVQVGPIEQPERVRCIKFVPRPGDHYVISGWVREDAVIAVDSITKNFEEVSPLFKDLLIYLKDKVLNNESLPEIYVLKSDPDAPNVDGLLPFIKDARSKNVTVYDFKLEREITDGIKRTIGFSFSLDPAKTYRYTYITPEVAYDLFGNIYKLGYHYPLLNNPSLAITFKKASVCETNFCITSDFTIDSDFPYLKTRYKDDVSERSSISGIKPSIEVFTYEEDPDFQVMDYLNTTIELVYKDGDENVIPMDSNTVVFAPNGPIIDGWQRITADFKIPTNAANLTISLKNKGRQVNAYFDDVRIYPFNGNMKSFVYDRITQRLMAELDENNYATFYEYDKEGGLVRVKKETEGGTYTIQETRSASSKIKR